MLNYKVNSEEIIENIDEYHLYEQETQGRIFAVLSKKYILKGK